jgi:hypothetical protein
MIVTNDTVNKTIDISSNLLLLLRINSCTGAVRITSPDSSVTFNDTSTASTIRLSSDIAHVTTLNGKSGTVNVTSDGLIRIDSTQANVIKLAGVGDSCGDGTPFEGNLDTDLGIGNSITANNFNLNDSVIAKFR